MPADAYISPHNPPPSPTEAPRRILAVDGTTVFSAKCRHLDALGANQGLLMELELHGGRFAIALRFAPEEVVRLRRWFNTTIHDLTPAIAGGSAR